MLRKYGPLIAALCIVAALLYVFVTQRTNTIFDATGDFGRVRVVERADGLRSLVTGEGRARQSAIYPGRPLHLELAYSRVGMIGLALMPSDGRILFVGLGGGAMPMYARQIMPEAHIDVVEIDPLIVEAAQQYFGFRPDERMIVHTGDGRAFIEAAPPGTYDLIVLDAFSDDEVPFALTTRQFLEAVRVALAPDGVVVSNLWSRSDAYAAMLATYDAVFDQVRLLRVAGHAQYILLAGPAARRLDEPALSRAARTLAQRTQLGFNLAALVADGYETVPRMMAPILMDSSVTP